MGETKIVSARKDKMDNPLNNGQRFLPLHDPLLGKEVMEPVQPPSLPLRYERRVAKSKESFSVLFANIEVSVERVHLVQRKEHENKPAGDGSPWAC